MLSSVERGMTLPATYVSSVDYINDCLGFLKSYQWLYNYHNTHVLVNNIFENFPRDWKDYFEGMSNEELNVFPLNQLKKNCPKTLQELMDKVGSLKPSIEVESVECVDEPPCNYAGLSQKKLHEILRLAAFIDDICRQYKLDFVLDIGSGLGYLSHLLNFKYNYKVLGIECRSDFVKLAYANQEKHHPNCRKLVEFEEHFISSESSVKLTELYEKYFSSIGSSSGCLTGLHACADLSICILELFSKLDFMKCLIIMPCCYHRIELEEESKSRECFKNFPSSEKFREVFKAYEADTYLRRPFLRLACQQNLCSFINMSQAEHENHAFTFLCRAILQEAAEIEKCEVRRLHRKSPKVPNSGSLDDRFGIYLVNLKNSHQINGPPDFDYEHFLETMRLKWNQHKGNIALFEGLTGLQAALQGLAENLVLLDRVEFLKEKGIRCEIRKVADESISPRCFAICAFKE